MSDETSSARGPTDRDGAIRLLRSPVLWVTLLIGGVLGLVMTYAYVGAFADPIGNLEGLPVGIVNEDEPVDVLDIPIDVGGQFVTTLQERVAETPSIELVVFDTEDAARRAIADNAVAGVIVLPTSVSADVAAIGTSAGKSPAATVTLLRNDGAGSLQPAVFDTFAASAIRELSTTVSGLLAGALDGLDLTIAASDAGPIADPVVAETIDVPGIGDHGGRGLPPMYVAVMVTLTAILSATALHVVTGTMAGVDHVEVLGRRLRLGPVQPATRWGRWTTEVVMAVPIAVVGGIAVTWMAVGIVGAHVDRPVLTGVFAIVGMLAMIWFSQAFLNAFGLVGDLIVILLTTIFGVPSARGVYPAEALPGFFRAIGTFLPLRWMTDGMRSLFFFDGSGTAGLTGAWVAVTVYAAVGLVLGALFVKIAERRARPAT